MPDRDHKVPLASHWMNVDLFTVQQAAALWINTDPVSIGPVDRFNPPEYAAIKQMLTAGIVTGQLQANTSTNAFSMIGNHSDSLVSRAGLEAFARQRKLFPNFLFDTLAPFQHHQNSLLPAVDSSLKGSQAAQEAVSKKSGGRPAQYDWDAFLMEIIRRANLPDGLPETQADLVRQMLSWFQVAYDEEPAESAVKSRISKIFSYLEEAKNSP